MSVIARRSAAADLDTLVPALLERQPRALGRAISVVEDGGPLRRELVGRIYPRTGSARVVGITGPPGAGKSTLVDRIAQALRGRDLKVAILAVDPTSPFTGGAILGDRIRMQSLYTDSGVFIRSMATRGAMGGLARATHDAMDLVDAAGYDWVLVETVGVGQDEVDIVRTVDTVAVVTVPGLGDDIQAIKAGLMEIADLFVVNKADRDGVDRVVRDLELMLSLGDYDDRWRPPLVKAVARQSQGIEEILAEIERHGEWLESGDGMAERRHRRFRQRVEELLKERVLRTAVEHVGLGAAVAEALEQRIDPYRIADRIFRGVVDEEKKNSS
ncbi:MAG: methylmalonyl Co-A mutase-associated GTPase MeaB [Thermoanaerobaculia bacterium]